MNPVASRFGAQITALERSREGISATLRFDHPRDPGEYPLIFQALGGWSRELTVSQKVREPGINVTLSTSGEEIPGTSTNTLLLEEVYRALQYSRTRLSILDPPAKGWRAFWRIPGIQAHTAEYIRIHLCASLIILSAEGAIRQVRQGDTSFEDVFYRALPARRFPPMSFDGFYAQGEARLERERRDDERGPTLSDHAPATVTLNPAEDTPSPAPDPDR